MARVKHYIDKNVLEATKERIEHIFDIFDTVVVMFSGGKDSLATLYLVKEEAEKRGQKVNVVFRDEELIPNVVIDFVDKYRQMDWIDMKYFAIPLASHKYILSKTYDYVQWDQNRKHVREVPEWAITLPKGDNRVFDQYTTDAFISQYYKGKIAFVTGMRASESLIRYQASVVKLNENYINASSAPNVSLCKPLYDWQEDDIFKYFWENDIEYCQVYDSQLFAGVALRVSTPIHAESAKHFDKLKLVDPVLYQQIVEVFPEMLVQERYYREYDQKAIQNRYEQSFPGIKKYIYGNITDAHQRKLALDKLNLIERLERNKPGSYQIHAVFRYIMSGHYKRNMMPSSRK